MGLQATAVSMFSKVSSLGARFFEKYVSTKTMNKKLTEINNLGLVDIITVTATSVTTDFGSLAVGDIVLMADNTSAFKCRAGKVVTAGTAPFTPTAIGNIFFIYKVN
tara:strand:- start:1387 stop:1707 length:321 start_codon:yes stop_codon:yes gene_type:complete